MRKEAEQKGDIMGGRFKGETQSSCLLKNSKTHQRESQGRRVSTHGPRGKAPSARGEGGGRHLSRRVGANFVVAKCRGRFQKKRGMGEGTLRFWSEALQEGGKTPGRKAVGFIPHTCN